MKSERLKLSSIFFITTLLFLFLSFLITNYTYQNYKKSINNYVYGIIAILKEKYSNITEEEIITILNNDYKIEYDSSLKKYGINEESPIIINMHNDYQKSIYLNLTFISIIFFLFIIFFFIYYASKDKKIREITHYMQEINHKNYELGILENCEGELSILRGEVYKTTIMLREESENLKKEKNLLKDSISDISHQLKTPLTSILIMLDNIIDNPNMDELTKKEFIESVYKQVEHINTLIIDMLKLTRLEAGVIEFKKEKINCRQILEKAIENVKTISTLKEVEIVSFTNEEYIIGDIHFEIEAITNILKNAIEYSKPKGKIYIKTTENSLFTKIIIEDEGIGISKQDLKNIFKRFYKGDNYNSDSIGIGLNLAKKIIEKDNGFIKVDSKKDKGTIFEIQYRK